MTHPTPIELRRAQGNPSGRPLPAVIVAGGKISKLEPPSHLDNGAVEVWLEVVPVLADVGIVDTADALMLEALCTAVAQARAAGEILRREGFYVESTKGTTMPHPAYRIQRDGWETARKIGDSFGLNPVSRTRMGLAMIKGKSLAMELSDRLG